LKVTIHWGCHEIGSSCVELQSSSDSLFIDFGMPLSEKSGNPFDIKSIATLTGPELTETG
jgi:Cft2 family RNA processing exonuclease